MSSDQKAQGRRDAIRLLNRKKETAADPGTAAGAPEILAAIEALAENRPAVAEQLGEIAEQLAGLQAQPIDVGPIAEAIAALDMSDANVSVGLDLGAVVEAIDKAAAPVDTKGIEEKLEKVAAELKNSNTVLMQLLNVARAPKTVKYDSAGRIIEISTGATK